jgi:hypothetical protein
MMTIALGVVLGLFIWHFVLPVALVLLAAMCAPKPPKPPPSARRLAFRRAYGLVKVWLPIAIPGAAIAFTVFAFIHFWWTGTRL